MAPEMHVLGAANKNVFLYTPIVEHQLLAF